MKRKHFIIAALFFLALLLYRAGALAVATIISVLFAYLLDPVVETLEKKKVNRKITVFAIYTAILLLFVTVGVKGGAYIFSQTQDFVKEIPLYMEKSKAIADKLGEEYSWLGETVKNLDAYFASSLQKFLKSAIRIVSQAVYLFLVYIFSLFILLNRDRVVRSARQFIGEKRADDYTDLLGEIDGVLRGFFRGRLLVCVLVFILTLIGTYIIRIKHPIFIAIFTGVSSFIPYYGALAGLLPGLLASLGTPNILKSAISLVILIVAVNSIESNLLTPFLTARHIKIHPAIIIFSVIAGGALFGFWGIFFSLPVAGIIKVLYTYSMVHAEKEG
ncbi:MAG: AI-2E family transporter [Deltaproteobacteria bacterium]|nr:AI-2E family transporter [Deltaproteobacteria bacterium]NIS77954.1 AI-2E family transporter [Deltaproteobacteria bacterium]